MSRTHGDVTAEYLAIRNAAGLVAGSHDLVSVQGPDAVSFLEGILSQGIAALPHGAVARSLVLGPDGKMRSVLWVLRGDQEVVLVTDQDRGELLTAELGRYLFRVNATIEPGREEVVAVLGPGAGSVLAQADLPTPSGWTRTTRGMVASMALGGLPRFLVVGADYERLVAAGARPAGFLAADAVRVEAGEPVMGRDLDEKTIPQESGLVPETVSFTKGCYLGQELVARIDSRGHVNRLLRGVVIGANLLPPEGAELYAADRLVGRLTSVAESLILRAPVGLALVRREVEAGSQVEVRFEGGSTVGIVHDLPLSDFTES